MPSLLTRARRLASTTAAKLADALGRPFQPADLGREHARPAGRGARPWTYTAVASGLTPSKLAGILTAADQGDNAELLTLAGDIERRDCHTGAQLRTRKLALTALPWQVEAASDDPADVALAEELQGIIDRPDFGFLVIDAMDAIMKGYAVAEIEWERGAKWTPLRFIWRDQRHFVVDKEDGTTLRLRTEAKPTDGEDLPAFKFIAHIPRLTSGPLALAGLCRPLSVMYAVKTLGVGAWLGYMEIFGIPTRMGTYQPGASEDDIEALMKAVAAIGFDGAGVKPQSTAIELLDAIGRGNGTGEHERLAEWADRQVSKAVLGQTMTADSGASLAQAKVHDLVRKDILVADAAALEATLQRDLIKVYVDINYGPREKYPRLRCMTEAPEDRQAFVSAVGPMIDRGLQVEQSVVRDRLGIPEPAKDAAVLSPANKVDAPASAEKPAKSGASLQHLSTGDEEDFIDAEGEPSAGVEAPLVEACRRAVEGAGGFSDFLARLSAETIDADGLVKELARLQLLARGVGDATDEVTP